MNFVEQFKDATIGFRGYTRLARTRGSGFGYMALLLMIVLAVSATIQTVQTKRLMVELDRQLTAAPEFGVKNGEFFFNGPMPYTVGSEVNQLIIDTTGKTSPEALGGKAPGSMLLTRDTLYQVSVRGDVTPVPLGMLQGEVTKADLRALMQRAHIIVPFAFLFIYVFQLGAKALDAIILAGLAALSARSWRREISFDLGYKLGLYALTLPTILQWIFPGYSSFSGSGLVSFWGLAVLYLMLGLRAYLRGEEPEA